MIELSLEQVIKMHVMLISKTGGSAGLRDVALLESAVFGAFQSFSDAEPYPTIEHKAARLCYPLIKNHAFVDGNKRIGIFSLLVFLELNGTVLKFTQDELVVLGTGVAAGDIDFLQLFNWVVEHR